MPDDLLPLDIPPGVYRNGTEYEAKGRWRDVNLIRWYNGRLRPVGGWQRMTKVPLAGIPRALLTWRDLREVRHAAIGTDSKLYVNEGGESTDITPANLAPGRPDSVYGLGFGASKYGKEAYGTERSSSGLILDATVWALDNFGQFLIACSPADGRIFLWNPTTTGPATVIHATAPTECRSVFVTDENFVVAIGANGDPSDVVWCSQGDYTVWTPQATNSAGELRLRTNGLSQSGRRMTGESLIFTDTDVHAMRYIGPPLIYGIERIGSNCGVVGPRAHAATLDFCVWMSNLNFFIYDGNVRAIPCDVQEYVFDDLNLMQGAKVQAGINSQYSEVWWFYPSAKSLENDRYVIWNYRENHWSIGQLSRTAWTDREAWPFPIAAAPDGNVYQHEQGWTDAGLTRVGTIYAQSGPLDFGSGKMTMDVSQAIPDTNVGGPDSVQYSFDLGMTPTGQKLMAGPYSQVRPDGYMDMRFSARQVKMRVDALQDVLFQVGTMRFDAQPGSGR
ncbi:hypothetical protein BAU07_06520 [Bordetella flabilis]|uniref:Uncharacterized protein n=2 Tax=Bordetella flabilis TaxID=463014 RepID=A0A193GB12_9BORD|nr:hypothetical protein BAU07_06520 [Bordetella flabilis]